MSDIPQPPAPPKWAREASDEILRTLKEFQGFETSVEVKRLIVTTMDRHHAAAQADTVALLEEYLAINEAHGGFLTVNCDGTEDRYCDCGSRFSKKLCAHLAQLKEGAP